jgi:hypothetical protein
MGLVQHCRTLLALSLTAVGISLAGAIGPAQAQEVPYCQQSAKAIKEKENLLWAAARGSRAAQSKYRALVAKHGNSLRQCRQRNYPQTSAIWLRLYPCDARPGMLDEILDRIVNRGYNQVNVEVFAGGKVLLPGNRNPTPWPSILAGTRVADRDLLAEVIRKGRERGLKVYAWLFTLNVGPNYLRRSDRQQAIARNGLGQTSLTADTYSGLSMDLGYGSPDEAFVDPYSPLAKQDYLKLVRAIVARKPDGVLFDYIRYPRGSQALSVASKVKDLWIYGESSQQILLRRALNFQGMGLIQRYLRQGFITTSDLNELNALYPQETEPMWQGRNPAGTSNLPPAQRLAAMQVELWQLSLSHAFQGVLDFLNAAAQPVQRARIPAGVVFFPEANQAIGDGYDSRLQFWEYFPHQLEWHPMSYGVCGKPSCIMAQVQRVLQVAPPGTQVKPVLAGIWQRSVSNRPPLEVQMRALYGVAPKLKTVSHFAYSWQEPGSDRSRKVCRP